MKDKLEKRNEYRLLVLRAVYELTDGNRMILVDHDELAAHMAQQFGVPEQETYLAIDYLAEKRKLTRQALQAFSISHEGVVEYEATIEAPDKKTELFDPPVINNVSHFHAAVGGVQTGSHNTMNVAQQINAPPEIMKHFAVLRAEAQKLPAEQRSEAIELVDAIEEESKSERPRLAKVKSYGQTLVNFMGTMAPVVQAIIEWIRAAGL